MRVRARLTLPTAGWLLIAALSVLMVRADESADPAGARDSCSVEEFRGPEFCGTCHPRHYFEWRGSAHAYSTRDPIFLACNRKAHEETDGAIGDLCIGCHAPIVDRTGELGPNFSAEDLDGAPPALSRGVTCEVCHRMEPPPEGAAIGNASFKLGENNRFFGRLLKPVANPVHESVHGEFIHQSSFCGSCHDVLHDDGSALEKTFREWSGSIQRKERNIRCQTCHMLPYSGRAAKGGPFRDTLHRHNFPGVSMPLMPFPNRGYQAEEIQKFLRTAARMSVLVPPVAVRGEVLPLTVLVKNSGAGHNLPSGISTFRQMWLEVTVRDPSGRELLRSGHRDAGGDLLDEQSARQPSEDAHLVSFADRFLDKEGRPVLFLWEAEKLDARSLRPLEERGVTYPVPVSTDVANGSRLDIEVRLLFRFFSPYGLRAFGIGELSADLPIWEMDAYRAHVVVQEAAPPRSEYRVPGDFDDVQTALDNLGDGDRVVVDPGEYVLGAPLDFRGKAIHLKSAEGPSETTLRLADGARGSVVVFRGGEGPRTRLEGFTITGGKGMEIDGLIRGGGIYISRSSPTLERNVIVGNQAAWGVGGGICCEGSDSVIRGNSVRQNWAARGGGLAYQRGSAPPEQGEWLLSGNTFEGNVAKHGGGLYLEAARPVRVERCVLAGNHALGDGGGVYAADETLLTLDYTTVFSNRARDFGALRAESGNASVSSSILWGNTPADLPATSRYSLFDGDLPEGPGNQSGFPLFADPTAFWEPEPAPPGFRDSGMAKGPWPGRWIGGDYRLLGASPAVDAGDPQDRADPDDSRADIGARALERPLRAFVRGDVDGDGAVAWADVSTLVRYLASPERLRCLDAADVDDGGSVSPLDVVLLGAHLLGVWGTPEPPFPSCGLDPTFGEGLSCDEKADPCVASEPRAQPVPDSPKSQE